MSNIGSSRINATLDEEDEIKEEEAKSGGLSAKKLLLFVVLPLLLIGGLGAAYFSGIFDKYLNKEGSMEMALDQEASGEPSTAAFVKIPDMIVNLSSDDAQPRYLRLSVQLELKNEADSMAVEQVMPRVIDQFQTYLRELRVKDLRGSAGIYRLQMELLSRVNAAAYPVEVQDVLFQEILIQ